MWWKRVNPYGIEMWVKGKPVNAEGFVKCLASEVVELLVIECERYYNNFKCASSRPSKYENDPNDLFRRSR